MIDFLFFFQAEDGIRDTSVTGVQTCALPIFVRGKPARWVDVAQMAKGWVRRRFHRFVVVELVQRPEPFGPGAKLFLQVRSEERRVGKECGSRRERDE